MPVILNVIVNKGQSDGWFSDGALPTVNPQMDSVALKSCLVS
jgi:hypothetical protein